MDTTQQAPPFPAIGSYTDRRALQPIVPPGEEKDKSLAGKPSDDVCAFCYGELAAYSGPVPDDKQPGPNRWEIGTARSKRKSWIGCGKCGRPVPVNHVRQVKLDAEWEGVEAKDKAEAERAAKNPAPPTATYKQLNPVQFLEEEIDKLRAELAAAVQRIAALEKARIKK
jgi:hypothetical protein